MKKFAFILGFVLISLTGFSQDEIIWKDDVSLSWDNFKAPPLEGMPMNAMTSARPMITMNSSQKGEDVTINYTVQTVFFPNESWALNKNNELAFLLEHEQLYFDIAELFARKLRKSLKEYNYTSEFASEYQGLYNHFTGLRNEYQQLFAIKTNFGGNTKEQKKWAKKIAKELEELSDYASPTFTVSFKAAEPVVEE